jgi:hypothetical protein
MKKYNLADLPTFEHCEAVKHDDSKDMTPLEMFIYNNEPIENDLEFRLGLIKLLNWVIGQV